MEKSINIIAVDLGAESGRVISGELNNQQLKIKELHRFPNIPVRLSDGLHWDVLRLWNDILDGLSIANQNERTYITSVGIDTWGVDFGLIDRNGSLLSNPFHYRDNRTDGMMEIAFRKMSREDIFTNSGIQFMQLNTLYQLLSMVEAQSPLLKIAETLLTMPDLFNFWFTGRKVSEFSIATTTQCFDPNKNAWSDAILSSLNIPRRLFPDIVLPGTDLGIMADWISERIGFTGSHVIAPACHDTGSAVAAVPAETENYVWISSGTWSIMGINHPGPVITQQSLDYNFTNEGAIGNSYRFSKNIMGLWLLQESRRIWRSQGAEYSYDRLTELAETAPEIDTVIDVDFPGFLKPGDMPERIRAYCRETHQEIPKDMGVLVRIILESIALKYRWVLEKLEEQIGKKVETIHIIGGGTQNKLLNQLTATATNRKVIAGPIEATAIGNILTQAITLGYFNSQGDIREVIRNSFSLDAYNPESDRILGSKYQKLQELIK